MAFYYHYRHHLGVHHQQAFGLPYPIPHTPSWRGHVTWSRSMRPVTQKGPLFQVTMRASNLALRTAAHSRGGGKAPFLLG